MGGCDSKNKKDSISIELDIPIKDSFIISSEYGWRWGKMHNGIDISGINKGISVYSTSKGIVTEVNKSDDDGNYIIIKHDNEIFSFYSHLDTITVSKNDKVNNLTKIGTAGDSGNATGILLHFGIYKNKIDDSNSIDPCKYLNCK